MVHGKTVWELIDFDVDLGFDKAVKLFSSLKGLLSLTGPSGKTMVTRLEEIIRGKKREGKEEIKLLILIRL